MKPVSGSDDPGRAFITCDPLRERTGGMGLKAQMPRTPSQEARK
jgi:hypothetical protein